MDSIDIAVADAGRDGEVRHIGSIGGDLAALDKALRKLISKGCRLHVAYEAGPCGFVIWRHQPEGASDRACPEPVEGSDRQQASSTNPWWLDTSMST